MNIFITAMKVQFTDTHVVHNYIENLKNNFKEKYINLLGINKYTIIINLNKL